jgi:nicotinamide mononucleotide transporter
VLEILAILSSLAYTVFYLMEWSLCWPFAIVGSLLYFYLCRKANLQGESWLQLFYVGFAVFGWLYNSTAFEHPNWSLTNHLLIFLFAIIIWQIFFHVLKKRKSALPQLDALVLSFALVGTVLQILYVEMNWIYFLVVNAVSIYTYWSRGMKKSVILYVVYLGLSLYGITQ